MKKFNRHYKKTGKKDYSMLKYKNVSAEKIRAKQDELEEEREKNRCFSRK